MQRKATKKTRTANAKEKQFLVWVKEQPCAECGHLFCIADHMYGATFKHNKILIGMWAILSLCDECDRVKTFGSHNEYKRVFGRSQAEAWLEQLERVPAELMPPQDVINSIRDWGR